MNTACLLSLGPVLRDLSCDCGLPVPVSIRVGMVPGWGTEPGQGPVPRRLRGRTALGCCYHVCSQIKDHATTNALDICDAVGIV